MINNKSYHLFGVFYAQEGINKERKYLDLLYWEKDTLLYNTYGYYKFIEKIYKEGNKKISISEEGEGFKFLVFSKDYKKSWFSVNPLNFGDSVKIESVSIMTSNPDTLYHFKAFHYDECVTHSLLTENIVASKKYGILSFKYYNGYCECDCKLVQY